MKKLFFILLGLILLVCAVDATLDFFYFAGPGKARVRAILQEQLGTRVEINKVIFRLASGFSIREMTVYPPSDSDQTQPFLTVKKMDVQLNYLGLLAKKWLIKNLTLKEPHLKLIRTSDGKWTLPPISDPDSRFFLTRLQVKKGSLHFTDHASGAVPQETVLSGIALDAHFALPHHIDAKFSCSFPEEEGSRLEATGRIALPSLEFHAQGSAVNFPVHSLEPYAHLTLPDLKALSGRLDGDFACSGAPNKPILLETKLTSTLLNLSFTPFQIQGGVTMQATSHYNPADGKWNYKGSLAVDKSIFSASFLPDSIRDLNGQFLFENDFLTTNGVEGWLEGYSVRARGTLEDFRHPRTRATLFTDLPLQKIQFILKDLFPSPFASLKLEGKCFTQMNFQTGELDGGPQWSGKLYLRESALQSPKYFLTCSQWDGVISFDPEQIRLEKLKGKIRWGEKDFLDADANLDLLLEKSTNPRHPWLPTGSLTFSNGKCQTSWLENPATQLQGEIRITPQPQFSFYFSSPDFSILSEGEIQQNTLLLKKFSGYGYGATCDLTGKIALQPQGMNEFQLQSKIDTPTLQKAWPTLWEKNKWLRDWAPEGAFEIQGKAAGALRQSSQWRFDGEVSGKRVSLKKIFLDDFEMKTHLADQKWSFQNIQGRLGDGTLRGNGAVDLSAAPTRYALELKSQNVPLERLPQTKKSPGDLPWRGTLEGGISLDGVVGSDAEDNGVAFLKVTDGELGDAPFIKPLWKVIRNIAPSLDKPLLHSATGDFTIRNGVFVTDNLELVGPGIILQPRGTIGMDEKVDLTITVKFFKPEGSNLKTWALEGLNLFGKLLEIQYAGTLSHPEITHDWLPALDKLVSGN